MTEALRTPVIVVLFNRPGRVRELLVVLREVRPTHVLAIADGPRRSHPSDREACRAAREELGAIDWPCTVERRYADENFGCDHTIVSGLDWAFGCVPRAIILEDDVLPHPSFLPWAEAMLDRFHDDPEVFMVSGHNPLGRWPLGERVSPAIDHVRARRGSIWGWATTAAAWRSLESSDIDGAPDLASHDLASFGLDPLLATHWTAALEGYRLGRQTAWDMVLGIKVAARRGVALVSSTNLVRNTGIGRGATRTTLADDYSGLVPTGPAPVAFAARPAPEIDPMFDRAAVLVELMARCADPPMAQRLARLTSAGRDLGIDASIRHHLAPFRSPREALRLLEHLARLGVTSPHFERLRGALVAGTRTAPA